MKAGKRLNRTIFTVLSLHLISACQTGKNPERVTEKPTIASYYQRAEWEGMIPPSPPIPIPVPNIECREKTVTLPPGTLTHPVSGHTIDELLQDWKSNSSEPLPVILSS